LGAGVHKFMAIIELEIDDNAMSGEGLNCLSFSMAFITKRIASGS